MLILSLIQQAESTAYDIEEQISTSIKIPEGSIYPLLHQLVKTDYVYINTKADDLGANKKIYYLTDNGINYYMQLTREWSDLTARINNIVKEVSND